MSAELVQGAVMANRDVPNKMPSPFQDCREEVHIAIFFDGTGNNKDADAKDKKWSNIARLFESAYRASQENEKSIIYPIYISGVGTEFNGEAIRWIDKALVWVEDNVAGAGAGAGGDRRLDYGMNIVNDHLRNAMIAGAQRLAGTVVKYAEENSKKSFADLNFVLAKHRLIKSINVSIFGFSRGAALARSFANRLIKRCVKNESGLLYDGMPLRIVFMGLFDTVASFGLPSQNVRTPFTERDLIVSPLVDKCVHYVAAHELRFSFPVDLIRKDGKLVGSWIEKVFPGVHSDVGGGYAPNEQGLDDNYARIPLREMLREALRSGVRILGYEDLRKLQNQLFQERFECEKSTEAAYLRYMSAFPDIGGNVEQQIAAHMKLYYSAYGTMYRKGQVTTWDRIVGASKVKSHLGPKGMASEVAAWRSVSNYGRRVRIGGPISSSFAQYLKPRKWQLAAWDVKASDGVVDFISHYVHDSKVDFLLNAEPFSYFSPRGVEESSISIWQRGGDWLDSNGKAVGNTAYEIVEKGQGKVSEIGEAMSKSANDATDAIKRISDHTAGAVSSAVETSTRAASNAYAVAAKVGDQAITVGRTTVDELGKSAEQIYESGTNWIRRKLD